MVRAKWSVLELIQDSVGPNVSNGSRNTSRQGWGMPRTRLVEKAVHKAGGKMLWGSPYRVALRSAFAC